MTEKGNLGNKVTWLEVVLYFYLYPELKNPFRQGKD